jgi:hypothetical protein
MEEDEDGKKRCRGEPIKKGSENALARRQGVLKDGGVFQVAFAFEGTTHK